MPWIKRLFTMHKCTVLILPKPLCRALDLNPGDYVTLEILNEQAKATVRKLEFQENPDHGSQRITPHPTRRR